jgi:hypothetical protein
MCPFSVERSQLFDGDKRRSGAEGFEAFRRSLGLAVTEGGKV